MADDADEIRKSIRKRFARLDFDDTPPPRPPRAEEAPAAPAVAARAPAPPAARAPAPPAARAPAPAPPQARDVAAQQASPRNPLKTDSAQRLFQRANAPEAIRAARDALQLTVQAAQLLAARASQPTAAAAWPAPRSPGPRLHVVVEEVELRRELDAGGGPHRGAPRRYEASLEPPPAPRGSPYMPPEARRRSERPPITLSAEAATQIRLMAHAAGVPGSGVRLLASGGGAGSAADVDFAFESLAEPDDVVLLSEGVQLYLDPTSFQMLRGLHITWDDLPGLAGFQIARRHRAR